MLLRVPCNGITHMGFGTVSCWIEMPHILGFSLQCVARNLQRCYNAFNPQIMQSNSAFPINELFVGGPTEEHMNKVRIHLQYMSWVSTSTRNTKW